MVSMAATAVLGVGALTLEAIGNFAIMSIS